MSDRIIYYPPSFDLSAWIREIRDIRCPVMPVNDVEGPSIVAVPRKPRIYLIHT